MGRVWVVYFVFMLGKNSLNKAFGGIFGFNFVKFREVWNAREGS